MTNLQDQKVKTEILAIIDHVIRLKRDTLGPNLLSDIRNELTRGNPAYHQMKRMMDRSPHKFRYSKLPPSNISSFEEDEETVFVPRGFKKSLINLANYHGQTIKFLDHTLKFKRDPNMIFTDKITLKKYQLSAISSMGMNREGVAIAPCGGGKTLMGIKSICMIGQPTLVLVHTTDLLNQWRDELADKATIPGTIGQWGAGVKRREMVTVGMIQTLVKMPVEELKEFLDNFGYIILDEAHHCPADTFLAVMNLSRASYRHGLTATPKRKDGLEFLMEDTIGPCLTEITDDDLIAEGRSQSCVVRECMTTFFTKKTADEWTKLIGELVNDRDRNRLIVRNIVNCWNEGLFPLVLSDRVGHCNEICSALKAEGMNAQLMTGSVPKNIRKQITQRSKEGLIDCIVATKVADEGLDIPNLSSIHLTCPSANEAKIKQRIGRIRRPTDEKTIAAIYDYVDVRVSSCVRMGKARKRLFKKWGFSFEKCV